MANKTTFKVNGTFTFSIKNELLSSSLFKPEYKELKLISILGITEAVKYSDVYTTHKNALPYDKTLPNDASELTFLCFKNSQDETIIIAEEYVDSSSITDAKSVTVTYVIEDVYSDDIASIEEYIKSLGYNPKRQ